MDNGDLMTQDASGSSAARLKVLVCSTEMEPFAKTGGLADVTAALTKRLAREGHEVKLFMPKFKSVYQTGVRGESGCHSKVALNIAVNGAEYPLSWEIYRDKNSGCDVVFVVNDDLYHRDHIYLDSETGLDYQDNDTRFIFFCRAALEIAKQMNWRPDLVHANDWQSGLTAAFLKTIFADDPFFDNTRSLLTIHNAAYQGVFERSSLKKLGIGEESSEELETFTHRGKLNFLKSAIYHADIISAVSERYAVEIQSSAEFGFGLEDDLRKRNSDIHGVINGVDYDIWNPETDSLLPYEFSVDDLRGKAKNKKHLQQELKLKVSPKFPLIGMVSRLTEQKGIELFLEIADDILNLDVQFVALGDGEKKYADKLLDLQRRYPKKMRVIVGFDNRLAHLIEAASDIYLMPSKYEPCGLNQLYSLRYGAAPVVRETGGLADTITECDPAPGTGVGFLFKNFSSDELLEAMCRALDLYADKKNWSEMIERGMRQDFSWEKSVKRYEELYRQALAKPAAVESLVEA